MESIEFLENVALMYDVLEELNSLSLLLYRNDLAQFHKLINAYAEPFM